MKVIPTLSTIRLARIKSVLKENTDKISWRSILIIGVLLILTISSLCYVTPCPKRYVVFAGYNANGEIAPYVKRYIKKLNEISDGVVYITDSPLSEKAKKEIAPYVIHGEYQRHGEYDWGSYKRGYAWLKANQKLENSDELIFANDSCYAPLQSFRPMFKKMRHIGVDFWGNTQNQKFNQHLQSYFLVFRRPVIKSKTFATFMENIKKQPDHSLYITEYEIKLTPMLENLGYTWTSYIPNFSGEQAALGKSEDPNSYPLTLVKDYHNQFLKRRTFTEKLPIEEDKTALLNYLQKHAPTTYNNIKADFPNAIR